MQTAKQQIKIRTYYDFQLPRRTNHQQWKHNRGNKYPAALELLYL